MDDELVHVLRGIWEAKASNAIPTTFRCAEGDVKYRRVGRREYREVV